MTKPIIASIAVVTAIAGVLAGIWKTADVETRWLAKTENSVSQGRSYTTIALSGATLSVEIADTPSLRREGLSNRQQLKNDEGILFIFDKPDYHGFWMKNMRFPIDIIWFADNKRSVDMIISAPPEGDRPKKIYTPREKALYALEVNAGFIKDKGIIKGDAFSFPGQTGNEEKIESKSPPAAQAKSQNAAGEPIAAVDPPVKNQVLADVPFTPQAPFGEWSDPRQEDGCEEASIIMAIAWVNGEKLTREGAKDEILKLAEFQKERNGFFEDTSAEDTSRLMREYYKHESIVEKETSIDAIKKHLAEGRIVIAPMDGQKLKNPYYTEPGPPRHMVLIIGYDDKTGEFITNDPGTRRGAGYRYQYQRFMDSIRDYPSGKNVPGEGGKTIIAVGK
ncbi:MAG: DUF192 domain-containing protein [Candidatus Jacksonbacteria bacterium]|nr:DUF192 domain-containing protein [Candidatus Jacksonbacteria bacterium]